MTKTLATLLEAANAAEIGFRAACRAHGFADEWAAYRAELKGQEWPAGLVVAHAAYIAKLHAFYTLRDGPNGFLGPR